MRKNEELMKSKNEVKMKFCLIPIYTMQTATAVVTSDQQGETKSTVSLAKLASIDAQLQSFLDATLDSTSLQSSSINVDLLHSIRGIQQKSKAIHDAIVLSNNSNKKSSLFHLLPSVVIAKMMHCLSWRPRRSWMKTGFNMKPELRWNADFHNFCATCKEATATANGHLKTLDHVAMSQFPLFSVSGKDFAINQQLGRREGEPLVEFTTLTTLASKTKLLRKHYEKKINSGCESWYAHQGLLFCLTDMTNGKIVASCYEDYRACDESGGHCGRLFEKDIRLDVDHKNSQSTKFDLTKTSSMTPEYVRKNIELSVFIDINGHRFCVQDIRKLPCKNRCLYTKKKLPDCEACHGVKINQWPSKWDLFHWPNDESAGHCDGWPDAEVFMKESSVFTVEFHPRIAFHNPEYDSEDEHEAWYDFDAQWMPHLHVRCHHGVEELLSRAAGIGLWKTVSEFEEAYC